MMQARPFLLINLFLILALFFLQYQLWFKPGGIQDYHHELALVSKQMQLNQQAQFENSGLALQVKRIQKNPNAFEIYAREELGMIKQDETFYQIIHEPKP